MENRPAFFKYFVPSICGNEMKIPPAFIQCIRGALPQTAALRDRYSNLWHVKVDEADNNWYFKDGWKKFVKDNLIKGGEIIVFDYFGRGFFGIKIYGKTGFETKGVGGPVKSTENHEITTNVKDDGREKQLNAGGAGGSVNQSGNKRNFDWYGAEIFQSGPLSPPVNPYFVTKVRQNRKGELYIPVDVISDHKLDLPEEITLVDPTGKEFCAKRKVWKDGRMFYTGGWRRLCDMNLVGNEDKCICEFIKRRDGDLYINVTLVRTKR